MIFAPLRTSRRHRPSLKSRFIARQEAIQDRMREQIMAKRIAAAIESAAPGHAPGWVCVSPASCVTCAARHQAMESAAIARQVGGVTS